MPMKRHTKLSELIRDSAKDAMQVDHSKYTPHYKYWHYPQPLGGCAICFAGAVIAGRIPKTFTLLSPADLTHCHRCGSPRPFFNEKFTEYEIDQLGALESVRKGDLRYAWERLHVPLDETTVTQRRRLGELELKIAVNLDRWIPQRYFSNWTDFDEFLVSMESLATALEEIEM